MPNLTPEGLRTVTDVATRHGVSLDVALTLLGALAQGNGRQAQFSHPELGGMGQWSQGGMIMVGDMFNDSLKAKVSGLFDDLTGLLADRPDRQRGAPEERSIDGQSRTRQAGTGFG